MWSIALFSPCGIPSSFGSTCHPWTRAHMMCTGCAPMAGSYSHRQPCFAGRDRRLQRHSGFTDRQGYEYYLLASVLAVACKDPQDFWSPLPPTPHPYPNRTVRRSRDRCGPRRPGPLFCFCICFVCDLICSDTLIVIHSFPRAPAPPPALRSTHPDGMLCLRRQARGRGTVGRGRAISWSGFAHSLDGPAGTASSDTS